MITIKLQCRHCQSQNIVRNGFSLKGKQKYLCRDCGCQSRQKLSSNAYIAQEREQILHAYEELNSLRGLTRTFSVSRNSVTVWIKKVEQLPSLGETLVKLNSADLDATTLELDKI